MNTSVDRHYYQGGYDFQFLNPLDSRYECPICLLCQRDPVQTVCGHRLAPTKVKIDNDNVNSAFVDFVNPALQHG